jgi:hypothetical protein
MVARMWLHLLEEVWRHEAGIIRRPKGQILLGYTEKIQVCSPYTSDHVRKTSWWIDSASAADYVLAWESTAIASKCPTTISNVLIAITTSSYKLAYKAPKSVPCRCDSSLAVNQPAARRGYESPIPRGTPILMDHTCLPQPTLEKVSTGRPPIHCHQQMLQSDRRLRATILSSRPTTASKGLVEQDSQLYGYRRRRKNWILT